MLICNNGKWSNNYNHIKSFLNSKHCVYNVQLNISGRSLPYLTYIQVRPYQTQILFANKMFNQGLESMNSIAKFISVHKQTR